MKEKQTEKQTEQHTELQGIGGVSFPANLEAILSAEKMPLQRKAISTTKGSADLYDHGTAAKLYNLEVGAGKRGAGGGKELVAKASQEAIAMGKKKLVLDSEDNGTGKLDNWYKNQGFKATGKNNGMNSFELPLQRKEASSNNRKTEKPSLQSKSANKTGLPDNLKSGIEKLSGYSMDDVRVHRNSSKPAQLQAYAYAQGTDIHLGPGQEKHLPHEAWHVVQQKQGRVKPTLQMKTGHLVNDNEGLEREADVMGEKVVQLKSETDSVFKNENPPSKLNYRTIQRATLYPRAPVKKAGIPRPNFTKEVKETIKLKKGQHRRHVVMSSRMREAIWAYHTKCNADQLNNRRFELQTIAGKNTLRTEMAKIISMVHNSMGNLFAGKGSENTAIGFAVNPLFKISDKISNGALQNVDDIENEVAKWDKKGIFGFALEHKKSIGALLIEWLRDKTNHGNDTETISLAIQDFAFSCSFDLAYEASDEEKDHGFPDHIDKDTQARLLKVANVLEEVIRSPSKNHSLYKELVYLIDISDKYG